MAKIPVLIVCQAGKDSDGKTEVKYSVWTPPSKNCSNPGNLFPFRRLVNLLM